MSPQLLHTLYERAVEGLPVVGRPDDAARNAASGRSLAEAASVLTRRYSVLGGSAGFLLGLPGYASMPITIPANIGAVTLLHLHLVATTARLVDLDLGDEGVRDRCIMCLLKDSEGVPDSESAEWMERVVGKLGERGMRYLLEQIVRWGGRGGAARGLPILGGVVGAVADGRSTAGVGRSAAREFLDLDD